MEFQTPKEPVNPFKKWYDLVVIVEENIDLIGMFENLRKVPDTADDYSR